MMLAPNHRLQIACSCQLEDSRGGCSFVIARPCRCGLLLDGRPEPVGQYISLSRTYASSSCATSSVGDF